MAAKASDGTSILWFAPERALAGPPLKNLAPRLGEHGSETAGYPPGVAAYNSAVKLFPGGIFHPGSGRTRGGLPLGAGPSSAPGFTMRLRPKKDWAAAVCGMPTATGSRTRQRSDCFTVHILNGPVSVFRRLPLHAERSKWNRVSDQSYYTAHAF